MMGSGQFEYNHNVSLKASQLDDTKIKTEACHRYEISAAVLDITIPDLNLSRSRTCESKH